HVGCADFPISEERMKDGTLLHQRITDAARTCLGIDISEEGVRQLRSFGFKNVDVLSAEDVAKLDRKFDLIVASDVMEHMTHPSQFLESVQKCLEPEGELLISLPNAFSWSILHYCIKGYEPTHYDHCFCFSVKTVSELCRRFGLAPVEL